MDNKSTLIMLGIIALVILPFVINSIIKRMKIKKLQNSFKELARDLNLSDHEIIHRQYAIGVDKEARKLAYLDSKKESSGTLVDLAEQSNCKVVVSSKIIELAFSPVNNAKSGLKLEVYNNPSFTPTSDDIAIAEKWAGMVNSGQV